MLARALCPYFAATCAQFGAMTPGQQLQALSTDLRQELSVLQPDDPPETAHAAQYNAAVTANACAEFPDMTGSVQLAPPLWPGSIGGGPAHAVDDLVRVPIDYDVVVPVADEVHLTALVGRHHVCMISRRSRRF